MTGKIKILFLQMQHGEEKEKTQEEKQLEGQRKHFILLMMNIQK